MRKLARSPVSILSSAGAETHSVIRRVRFLQQINAALASVLPPSAALHVGVAGYQQGELVLVVDSGSWATRLRYQQEILRRALAQSMRLDLDRLRIRVRPPVPVSQAAPVINRRLSAGSRQHLIATAKHIEDANLAQALTRLARSGNAPEEF